MKDPMAFTDSDREAVLTALAEEVRAKHEKRPYSEAVIAACEIALRVNARTLNREPPHYTMPHVDTSEGQHIPRYWWQDND